MSSNDGLVAASSSFAHSLDGLRGRHKRGRLHMSYRTAGGERDSDSRCRHVIGHLGDGDDVERAEREERRVQFSAELLDGRYRAGPEDRPSDVPRLPSYS